MPHSTRSLVVCFSVAFLALRVPSVRGRAAPAAKAGPAAAVAPKLRLRPTDGGVQVDAGSMGQFVLSYPELRDAKDAARRPTGKTISGNRVALEYAGGGKIGLTCLADGTIALAFASMPRDVKTFRMGTLIDFSYAGGGTWEVAGGPAQAFPKVKPDKPFLYQGNVDSLALANFEGKVLTFAVPKYSYIQLQDNREWGWKIFAWFFQAPYDRNVRGYQVRLATGASGSAGRKVLVDKFGQSTGGDYPGKVKSLAELKADVEAEKKWLASLAPPPRDKFGGLPGSGEKLGLKKTGFFYVETAGNRWVLVDPAGNAFFHLGVCAFQPMDDYTYLPGRKGIYEWLPPTSGQFATAYRPGDTTALSFHLANRIRKTGRPFDMEGYQATMIARVRRWGFNSAGAFSPAFRPAQKAASFPYVASLPLSRWDGVPPLPGVDVWDPFDETSRRKVDELFAQRVAPQADDPLLIGYFLANEPLFEDLPKVLPSLTGKFACKRRLVQALKGKYSTIAAFNRAWSAQAASFDELADRGLPVTTAAASRDVEAFTGVFLEEYFRLVAETFHKYDRNHMLLGNRFQSGTINNEQLCRICGKYLDAMSFNYYTYYLDKDFLDRIHGWTGGKPMILSEFYFNCPADSLLPGGGKDVASQRERGLGYRNYVEQAAVLKYVVGIEWFTLVDQSVTGRWFSKYNGENGNTGLISVADRPWRTMLHEMMKTNYGIHDVWLGRRPPFVYDDARFTGSPTGKKVAKISRAAGPIEVNGLAVNWPGTPAEQISAKRLVLGAASGGVECAFKLCWDDKCLYVLANVADATPMKNNYKGGMIWSGDGLELFVGHEEPDKDGKLLFGDRQVLLSAGKVDGKYQWHFANSPKQYDCRMHVAANVDGKGYTLEAAIPFEALGFVPTEGMALRFDLGVDDSADGRRRDRQLMWNGTDRNSGDRTNWGRAVLAK